VTQSGRSRGTGSIGRGAVGVVRTSLNDGAPSAAEGQEPALAPLSALEDGGYAEAEAVVDGSAESLVLHRDGDNVRAWLNVCPHAGRRLDWAPGKFLRSKEGLLVCAVHGASFEPRGGTCVAGPCRGDALRAVPVVVRDGAVYLRTAGSPSAR